MSNRRFSLFDIDFDEFVDGFLLENDNQIFFSIYLEELKNNGRKELHKKEDFTRMCLEIQTKTRFFHGYFIRQAIRSPK